MTGWNSSWNSDGIDVTCTYAFICICNFYTYIMYNSDICAKYKPCFPVWLITLQLLSRLRFVRSTLPIQRSLIGSKLWITHPIHGWTLSCLVQLSLSGVFSWDHQIMIYIYIIIYTYIYEYFISHIHIYIYIFYHDIRNYDLKICMIPQSHMYPLWGQDHRLDEVEDFLLNHLNERRRKRKANSS